MVDSVLTLPSNALPESTRRITHLGAHMNKLNFPESARPASQDDTITANPFWPSISIPEYRATMNVDDSVPAVRVKTALIAAITTVSKELRVYRLAAIDKGIDTLAACEADEIINGVSVHVHSFKQAVYSFANVEILEKYATFAATGNTAERAEAKQEQANDFRCMGHNAVADILGRNRCDSELI